MSNCYETRLKEKDLLGYFCPKGTAATRRVSTIYYSVGILSIMNIGLFEEIVLSNNRKSEHSIYNGNIIMNRRAADKV